MAKDSPGLPFNERPKLHKIIGLKGGIHPPRYLLLYYAKQNLVTGKMSTLKRLSLESSVTKYLFFSPPQ